MKSIFPKRVRLAMESVTNESKSKNLFTEKPNRKILDPRHLTPDQSEELLIAAKAGKRKRKSLNPEYRYKEHRLITIQDRVRANNAAFKQSQIV
jgi:hypothetical protein